MAGDEADVERGVGRLPSRVAKALFLHAKICNGLGIRPHDEGKVSGGPAEVGVEALKEVGEEDEVVDGHADAAQLVGENFQRVQYSSIERSFCCRVKNSPRRKTRRWS